MIEQTGLEYNLTDDSVLLKFNIDGSKLKTRYRENNDTKEEEIFIKKGDMIFDVKDNKCKNVSLTVHFDMDTFEYVIMKTPPYIFFKDKLDLKVFADPSGYESIIVEYILKPDLLKHINLPVGENQWLEFDQIVTKSLNLQDTSNYSINNIFIDYGQPETDELENIFWEPKEEK